MINWVSYLLDILSIPSIGFRLVINTDIESFLIQKKRSYKYKFDE